MDAGDHTKIQPPAGHEAVHVCHKCGWPFPNSHPSARHRRAHKKVCGTLEGYKLVDSNVSDDDSHSDEDHKTPSPRVLERSINEKGSGGTGSNRSEYELFTDAAAEFSDSSGFSPGVEERFVDARRSTSSMERVANDDSSSSQSVKDGAIADIIQQPSVSADGYQMKNHEVPDCTTDQLLSTLQYQNDMPSIGSIVNFVQGHTAEESVIVLSNDSNSPSSDSYPIKYEKPADDTSHESEAKPGETVTERLLEVIGQDKHSGSNQEVKLDSVSQDIMTEHSTTEMTEIAHKMEETKEPEAMSADGVFQSKKERTERLNPKKSSDFYEEMRSFERSDDSSDTSQINVVAAQATDSTSSSYVVEGSDRKEVNEIVHVLSVPGDISIVAHPEVMLEGFKDHKRMKLHQPSSSCEGIDDKEDNLQSPLCEENSSNFQSRQLSEDSEVNCSIMPVLEDKLDDRNSKSALKEVPFKGEASLPEVMVTIDENKQSDEVGVPEYAATDGMIKSHTVSFTKEVMPHDNFKGSSPMTFPDVATEVVSDVNFVESSVSAKVNEETSSVNLAEAGNYEKGRNEKCDTAGTENPEGVTEDNTENTAKAHEFSSNISEFHVSSVTNLSNGNSAGDQDHCKSEKCDISENSISGELEENISIDTKSVPDCASNLNESQVATEDVKDGSIDKVLGIGYTHLGTVSDSSRIGTVVPNIQEGAEDKINGSNSVQVEHIVGVSLPTKSQHGNDVKVFHKTSEYPILKEPVVSYDAVEENDLIEIGEGTSTIGSETLQVEGDSSLAKQHFAAADISIDSCSRTDSLDAHWGSVSVLSTQSDVPTIIDAESLRSTDSLAPAAENASLRKVKGSDKSDVFEQPSLLTLVGTGQKVDGSEIQGNAQQSASQQAGWFPSLTNVVNESPGRKKNEEIIAKVTNWSSGGTGMQQIPGKSLVCEAGLETKAKCSSPKEIPIPEVEKDDRAAKGNGGQAATVNSILGTESPAAEATTGKELSSPERYPSDIKREKRKVKGLWAPFVCCYSVN